MFRGRVRHVHFVGVGGIGMSGLAEILRTLEFDVSGSDRKPNDITKRLETMGVTIHEGHRAENVAGADVVVYSSAIPQDNPEIVRARELDVPIIPRAEMLAELMRVKYCVTIAGSHGKTTTTSLVSTVLRAAGLDPTVVVGGQVNALGSNARLGAGDLFVAEADESDGSFLRLTPTIAVVTNIDPEHLDHYGTHENLKDAFVQFINRIPFYGLAALCVDHPHVQEILPRVTRRHVTYGVSRQADYRASQPRFEGLETRFQAYRKKEPLGDFTVRMPGAHNILNSLAVLAVADELAIPLDVTRDAIASFHGVQRRFTVVGQPTLTRAGEGGTQALFDDFTRAFNKADVLFVTDVYPAGEAPIEGATGSALAGAIHAHGHHDVTYVADKKDIAGELLRIVRPGDLVICLGAGDINASARELAKTLDAEAKA
jgi:UDP-N-acetylmuramate--alanine ligase